MQASNHPPFNEGRVSAKNGFAILTPVFDDWESLSVLLDRIDRTLEGAETGVLVVVVNDGSISPPPSSLRGWRGQAIEEVRVVNLKRNLGHQRAIAVGLAYLEEAEFLRSVIVMDSDGEDKPEDLPALLSEGRSDPPRVIFAERSRRFEPLWFRVLYQLYRGLHYLLTGIPVRVGNFSYIPASIRSTIVVVSGLWSHYAASVFEAKIPRSGIALARGTRISGQSRMNLLSLVNHGLTAISVFADRLGLRLLAITGAALFVLLSAFAFEATLMASGRPRVFSITLLAIAAACALQCAVSIGLFLMTVLSGRDRYNYIPIRDYRYFIKSIDP
jgi:polyisoprenyl-phosphate glycosyltransferase